MENQVYIVQGDITRIQADAVAVTQGVAFNRRSPSFRAFTDHFRGEVDFTVAYDEARVGRGRASDRAFFVTCSADRAPHGVAFVVTVAESPGEDPAARSVRDAVDCAVRGLRTMGKSGHLLIALIGFRLGFGGDRDDRLRSARAQVGAAYDAIADQNEVDLAFVLPDATTYAIFLNARRQERATRGIDSGTECVPDGFGELVASIQNSECVLFVGAGMSQNANLKSYPDLVQRMATELNLDAGAIPDDLDAYLDIAQWYRDRAESDGAPERVERLIHEHFHATGVHPSPSHFLLLSLPFRFCVTTNYDHLVENTLRALRRHSIRVVSAEDVARTGYRDATFVVKLHGDAETGNAVLSRDDYDAFFQRTPEMATLLEGLLLNQTFFFVGYSLRDPDFRQIFAKIRLMLRSAKQPAYVITFGTVAPYLRHRYERSQLRLIELDGGVGAAASNVERKRRLTAFLDQLSEAVTSGGGRVLLAPDRHHPVEAAAHPLRPLRRSLRAVGDELQDLIERWSGTTGAAGAPPTLDDIRTVARTLAFLADHGWRPKCSSGAFGSLGEALGGSGTAVALLWRALASLMRAAGGSEREQRQLLISALRYADDSRTADRLEREAKAFGL